MEILKQLSASEIVSQIVSFLVLFFVLRAFLWGRILKALDERKAAIAAEFQRIEGAKSEIERIKAEYEQKMSAIEEMSREKVQAAVSDGVKLAQEIKEKAQSDAKAILEKARENVELELAKAREELKDKVIELTIMATERLIKEKLTPEKDRRLAADFLNELNEARP